MKSSHQITTHWPRGKKWKLEALGEMWTVQEFLHPDQELRIHVRSTHWHHHQWPSHWWWCLCFQISYSSLWCLRIFTKGEHTEIKGLVLSLFQTTFTSFTFWMDTSQAVPLSQRFLHVFSFRKLPLSETGHLTPVIPNPGVRSRHPLSWGPHHSPLCWACWLYYHQRKAFAVKLWRSKTRIGFTLHFQSPDTLAVAACCLPQAAHSSLG